MEVKITIEHGTCSKSMTILERYDMETKDWVDVVEFLFYSMGADILSRAWAIDEYNEILQKTIKDSKEDYELFLDSKSYDI